MAATTSTTVPATIVGPDPKTAGEISDDQLLFMTLDPEALGDAYRGFEEVSRVLEDNLTLARKTLQDPSDEANDIAVTGRAAGARAELRPRAVRVGTGDISVLQSWVSLFDTDEGAAAYLDDFVQDAGKGIGGGIPTDLEVLSAESFALDPIASQTAGLILSEQLSGGFVRYQTLVGFRVGRLLGFVSVVHADDGDRRLRVIRLAEALLGRIEAVLSGELVPPEPPPVLEDLASYRFEYRQTTDKGRSQASITATGIEIVGEALKCRLVFDFDGLSADRTYVIVGDSAQVIDQNAPIPAYEATSRDAFNTASDLIYCPGWPVELLASGLDVVLAGRPIVEITVEDDLPAVLYELDEAAAVAIGFLPAESGISVDRFEVTTDDVNPWVRMLVLELSGRTSAFARAFGEEFAQSAGNRVEVAIEFSATGFNDPSLEVTP